MFRSMLGALALTVSFAVMAHSAVAQQPQPPNKSAPATQAPQPAPPPVPSFACRAQINNALKSNFGFSITDMTGVVMNTDSGALGSSPEAVTYKFCGHPPSCPTGTLVLRMWQSCMIYETDKPKGCKL